MSSERDLERCTEDLYEDAPCAYFSTLPDGTIIRANRTFVAWLGMAPESVVGARFQSFLTIGSRIYYETHYSPLLQMQGFVNEIALEIRQVDGEARPVVASARQLRSPDGVTTVSRVALFDSTDRRRYERELLRARKLAEEAAQQLSAADQRKNDFIAVLAHELRSPLAPIQNVVEILRRTEHANDIVAKAIAIMTRQVSQMARLVDDLLDVSRIGQEKLALKRVPVDLASIIHQAVETSAPLMQAAGVSFHLVQPPLSIYVDADATRLAQAIGNVLNNASKFTPQGGSATLTVERSGDHAVIRVRDTGVGIEASQLVRVFDLFMQAEESSRRKDGLGIGLTLAKSLVERHDGHISVESAGLGLGSEFTISLPVLTGISQSESPVCGSRRDARGRETTRQSEP